MQTAVKLVDMGQAVDIAVCENSNNLGTPLELQLPIFAGHI